MHRNFFVFHATNPSVTYSAEILKIYSTKQNSIWIIEGVTYQRTNAPNLSSKDGLIKEIENHEQEQKELVFELWSKDISGERVRWLVER
jgi:hypothetical protein